MFINNNYNPKEVAARIIQNCNNIVANKKPSKRPELLQVNEVEMPVLQPDFSLLNTFTYTIDMVMDEIGVCADLIYRKNLRTRLMEKSISGIDYIKIGPRLRKEAMNIGMKGVGMRTHFLFSATAIEKARTLHQKGKLK